MPTLIGEGIKTHTFKPCVKTGQTGSKIINETWSFKLVLGKQKTNLREGVKNIQIEGSLVFRRGAYHVHYLFIEGNLSLKSLFCPCVCV